MFFFWGGAEGRIFVDFDKEGEIFFCWGQYLETFGKVAAFSSRVGVVFGDCWLGGNCFVEGDIWRFVAKGDSFLFFGGRWYLELFGLE